MLQRARKSRPFDADAAVLRVRDAIVDGTLTEAHLSARSVASFLGLTTSVFYHHFGSFELFLYAVSVSGLSLMADEMEVVAKGRSPLLRIAQYYVELALTRPVLFDLMLVRTYPWAEIRERCLLDTHEGLRGWNILIAAVRDLGSRNPLEDARLFHATLYGLAMLTRNGRMNVDDLEHTDREVAHRTVHRLVRAFTRSIDRSGRSRRPSRNGSTRRRARVRPSPR